MRYTKEEARGSKLESGRLIDVQQGDNHDDIICTLRPITIGTKMYRPGLWHWKSENVPADHSITHTVCMLRQR